MRDETLAELLRSPLDEDRSPRGDRGWVAPFLGALVVGLAAGLAWAVAAGGEQVTVTATTAGAATTTPGASAEPFPADYAAYADGAALQVVGGYARDGDLTVIASTVAAAGEAPADVPVFPGATWSLIDVEGRTFSEYVEVTNPEALGVTAVRFASSSIAEPRALVVRPDTPPAERVETIEVEVPGLPFVTGRSFEVVLADNLRFRGILLGLDEEAGFVRWSLQGADAKAQVDITVTLPETAIDDIEPTRFVSEHIAPPYPFQRPRMPTPAPAASGEDVLRRVGEEIDDPEAITRAVIDVVITFGLPQDEVELELELAPVVLGP